MASMNHNNGNRLTRREFLKTAAAVSVASSTAGIAGASVVAAPELREAQFYEKTGDNTVRCGLCPWNCVVAEGKRGNCGVRENRRGRYYSLVYGRPCSMHNDPIEKKPFFHVYPGAKAYSIATVGCNMHCLFCQNWEISQFQKTNPDGIARFEYVAPDRIAALALKEGSKAVAYTYSEPTVFYEYMSDCARAAADRGLGNIMVSNGFISEAPLKALCGLMTAIKIDLKAFTEDFYARLCGGSLEPVLNTLKTLADSNTWFEVVVLLIPTRNDGIDEIKRMTGWMVQNLGPDVPVHFSRFHPTYRLANLPRTPPLTLQRARDAAKREGCRFVYTGNLPGDDGENTYCAQCGRELVNRHGATVLSNTLKNGKCPDCHTVIPGVWA